MSDDARRAIATVTLTPATQDDLDATMALETASFPTDAWSREMMAEELASDHNRYFVARSGGELLGYAGLRAPNGAREADVQTIAVDPAARGLGLGRKLMDLLLSHARESRMREVFLEVRADNDVARALYDSLGFEALGVRPKYYQPDGVDAVVMRLTLAARQGHTITPQAGAAQEPRAADHSEEPA